MYFASDNAGPVHPRVMDALIQANRGHVLPYGRDDLTELAVERVRSVFEAPAAAVYFVGTGTAANALALACLSNPWDAIFCTPVSHAEQDECNAPEFFSGGAKLALVGHGDRMSAQALDSTLAHYSNVSIHQAQMGPVTLSQLTEYGRLYSLDALDALGKTAQKYNAPVHMDGTRLANACAALGCSAADMTWRRGIDALSFGGTKNGLMGVEAVVLFDPARAREFELRRKRGAHLSSKHRFLAAQMAAYLEDGLWLEMATKANASGTRLAQGLRADSKAEFKYETDANMIFCTLPRATHHRLRDAGAQYELHGALSGPAEEHIPARLVCDWSLTEAQIDEFLALL